MTPLSRPILGRTQLPALWLLVALWIAVMFLTFEIWGDGGRVPVMNARLLAGAALVGGLALWLWQRGQPVAEGLGWRVRRRDWPVTLVVLALAATGLSPTIAADGFASALQPALTEETLFRGFVFGVVLAVAGPGRALLWSAALFAGIHTFEGLGTALGSLVGALLLGSARLATGNVAAPVAIHALMNAGQMPLALLVWTLAVVGSGLIRARQTPAQPGAADGYLRAAQTWHSRLGHGWLAWPLAFEVWVWLRGRRTDVPAGEPLSARPSPLEHTLLLLTVLIGFEAIAVHFMIRASAGPGVALAVTALEALAILWLLALRRQFVLRRTTVQGALLTVRCGLVWTAEVPRAAIADVVEVTARPPEALNLAPAERANVLLVLAEPVVCRGLWGWPVRSDRLALRVDRPGNVAAWHRNAPTGA